jgi:hypothetical protein
VTASLYVCVLGTSQVAEGLRVEREAISFVKTACKGAVPHNLLEAFRVVRHSSDESLQLEPFVGAASLLALLAQRRKKQTAGQMLRALVDWAQPNSTQICLQFFREDKGAPRTLKERRTSLAELLSQWRLPEHEIVWLEPD